MLPLSRYARIAPGIVVRKGLGLRKDRTPYNPPAPDLERLEDAIRASEVRSGIRPNDSEPEEAA